MQNLEKSACVDFVALHLVLGSEALYKTGQNCNFVFKEERGCFKSRYSMLTIDCKVIHAWNMVSDVLCAVLHKGWHGWCGKARFRK